MADEQPAVATESGGSVQQDLLADLYVAHQAQALDHLNRDRCLLRRNTKASQNRHYGLPQEDLPDCEADDVGVSVGNKIDNSRTVHNHYPQNPEQPQPPQPCPPPRRMPWWALALIIIPWAFLATALVWWLLQQSVTPPPPQGGVGWELDIGAENPGESLPAAD